MNPYAARTGGDSDLRPAAVHAAGNLVTVAAPPGYGRSDLNTAGACGGIQIKAGFTGPVLHVAGTGLDSPQRDRHSAQLDATGAGARHKAAVQIAQLNVARAGGRAHVAFASLLSVDIA